MAFMKNYLDFYQFHSILQKKIWNEKDISLNISLSIQGKFFKLMMLSRKNRFSKNEQLPCIVIVFFSTTPLPNPHQHQLLLETCKVRGGEKSSSWSQNLARLPSKTEGKGCSFFSFRSFGLPKCFLNDQMGLNHHHHEKLE